MDLMAYLKESLGIVVIFLAFGFGWLGFSLIELLTDNITDRWWK